MKKYGLPTFPIYNGMDIGYDRDDDEFEWLLEHGYFHNGGLGVYYAIRKQPNGQYALLTGNSERYLQYKGEDIVDQQKSLNALLTTKVTMQRIGSHPLGRWQWFEK